jgi:hypothetical protein
MHIFGPREEENIVLIRNGTLWDSQVQEVDIGLPVSEVSQIHK